MDNETQILKDIVMKTMDSVDNLAIQVAELNTTLKENVLDDIRKLQGRADRHRHDIDALFEKHTIEDAQQEQVKRMLKYLYGGLVSLAIPVIAILIDCFI